MFFGKKSYPPLIHHLSTSYPHRYSKKMYFLLIISLLILFSLNDLLALTFWSNFSALLLVDNAAGTLMSVFLFFLEIFRRNIFSLGLVFSG